jgi:hypothetical protein
MFCPRWKRIPRTKGKRNNPMLDWLHEGADRSGFDISIGLVDWSKRPERLEVTTINGKPLTLAWLRTIDSGQWERLVRDLMDAGHGYGVVKIDGELGTAIREGKENGTRKLYRVPAVILTLQYRPRPKLSERLLKAVAGVGK